MSTVTIGDNDVEGKYGINIEFNRPTQSILDDGFNEWGVRENEDGSVDVRFEAMEPGERRGAQITPEFLQNVIEHDYDRIPVQLDHSDSQRANVGYIDPTTLQFSEKLALQAHIPNTGSSLRDDIIADFTHEPPQIQDISVSFDPKTVEVEPPNKRGEPPEFVDARFREVSLTPFPGGYDNGGITPEFSSDVEKAMIDYEFSDEEGGDDEAESQLIQRPHILIKN